MNTDTTLTSLLESRTWLRDVARAVAFDPSDSEDAVQDLYMQTLTREQPEVGDFRAWARASLRNVASSAVRSRSRRRERESRVAQEETREADELGRTVARAVLDLEEPHRTTILLRFYGGMSSADIAEHMNVAPSTVRTRMQAALEQLRLALSRDLAPDGRPLAAVLAPLLGSRVRTSALLGFLFSRLVAFLLLLFASIAAFRWMTDEPPPAELVRETAGEEPIDTSPRRTVESAPAETPPASTSTAMTTETPQPAKPISPFRLRGDLEVVDARGPVEAVEVDLLAHRTGLETATPWRGVGRAADGWSSPRPVRVAVGPHAIPVPEDGWYVARVSVPGAVGFAEWQVNTTTAHRKTVRVHTALSVRVSAPGRAVSDVSIVASPDGTSIPLASTDDGSWELDRPVLDAARLRVTIVGEPAWVTTIGPRADVELKIPGGQFAWITVRDAATERPIVGATAEFNMPVNDGRVWTMTGTSDSEGRMKSPATGESKVSHRSWLEVSAAGHDSLHLWHFEDILSQKSPDDPIVGEIRLEPVGRRAGTVLLANGEPAARTVVLARHGGHTIGQGVTDEDGRFVLASVVLERQEVLEIPLEPVPPEARIELFTMAQDGSIGYFGDVAQASLLQKTWRGVIEPVGALSVAVYDGETDEEIVGAMVCLCQVKSSVDRLTIRLAPTADDGLAHIAPLTPGPWCLSVSKEGYGTAFVRLPQDPLEWDEFELELEPAKSEYPVRMAFRTPDGSPLVGGEVVIQSMIRSELWHEVALDAEGRISVDLDGRHPYPFPIELKVPGYRPSVRTPRLFAASDDEYVVEVVESRLVEIVDATSLIGDDRRSLYICGLIPGTDQPCLAETWYPGSRGITLGAELQTLELLLYGFEAASVEWGSPADLEDGRLVVDLRPGPDVSIDAPDGLPEGTALILETLRLNASDGVNGVAKPVYRSFNTQGERRDDGTRIHFGRITPGTYRLELWKPGKKLREYREYEIGPDDADLGTLPE